MDVGIIGGGLSGLSLALALHHQNIKCTVYEARSEPSNMGSALALSPNGLKVLDRLGVYEPLKSRGHNFDNIYFQDGPSGRVLETIECGNLARYGLRALRTYRYVVLEELLRKLQERSVPVHFNHRFDGVISETRDKVVWKFTDGSTASASFLVGADGIHSAVRSYISPVRPVFLSAASIFAAVPTAQLGLPPGEEKDLNAATNLHPLPSGIVVPGHGAFVTAPQTYNGDEVMITVMRPMAEEHPEARWAHVDKEHLKALFRQNSQHFPPLVQNAVRNIPDDKLFVWPFYQIPRLDRWTSANVAGGFGRVAILGDSAHALPPSAAQGANQALEDVYTFALVLGRLAKRSSHQNDNDELLQRYLLAWQEFRQSRVDQVLLINKQMDLRRMPKAPGAAVETNGEQKLDLGVMYDWLFNIDYDKVVDEHMKDLTDGSLT